MEVKSCSAKNRLNTVKGIFRVHGNDNKMFIHSWDAAMSTEEPQPQLEQEEPQQYGEEQVSQI